MREKRYTNLRRNADDPAKFNRKVSKLKCPKCSSEVNKKDHQNAPFCSKKCQEADLYSWLTEGYKITRELSPEDWEDPKIQESLEKYGHLNPYDPRFL